MKVATPPAALNALLTVIFALTVACEVDTALSSHAESALFVAALNPRSVAPTPPMFPAVKVKPSEAHEPQKMSSPLAVVEKVELVVRFVPATARVAKPCASTVVRNAG